MVKEENINSVGGLILTSVTISALCNDCKPLNLNGTSAFTHPKGDEGGGGGGGGGGSGGAALQSSRHKINNDYHEDFHVTASLAERAAAYFSQPSTSIALFITTIAVVLNVVSLAAVCAMRKKWSFRRDILISLLVSNLVVDVSLIGYAFSNIMYPQFHMGNGAWNDRLNSRCSFMVLKALNNSGLNCTLLNLVAMAVNHYIGIFNPFHLHTVASRKRSVITIFAIWIIGLVAGFSDFLSVLADLKEYREQQYYNLCEYVWLSHYQEEYVTFGIALISLLVMLIMHGKIYREARDKKYSRNSINGSAPRKNKKAFVTTLLVLGSFMICWLPVCLYNLVLIILVECGVTFNHDDMVYLIHVDKYLFCLLHLSTVMDPIIYAVRVKDMRIGYWRVLLRCLPQNTKLNGYFYERYMKYRADSAVPPMQCKDHNDWCTCTKVMKVPSCTPEIRRNPSITDMDPRYPDEIVSCLRNARSRDGSAATTISDIIDELE